MAPKTFHLIATVSTDNPGAIHHALKELIGPNGTVDRVAESERQQGSVCEFSIRAELTGDSANHLNKHLLSTLRAIEPKTKLRSAWSCAGEINQFVDYAQTKKSPKKST